MKIIIIGATGFVGSKITKELVERKLDVTGISRNEMDSDASGLTYKTVDILDVKALTEAIIGYDVVISAYSPGINNDDLYNKYLNGSNAILEAVKSADVKRFIIIGGAGSLYLPDGVQLVDTDQFPEDIKACSLASRDFLNTITVQEDLNWTFFSPAIEMHPGITTGRTGNYRLGTSAPVFNAEGRCILSVEDVAVVIADELQHPAHVKKHFTAAY